MKINPNLVELMAELKPLTADERLQYLLEIARLLQFPELERAILGFWLNDNECQPEIIKIELSQEEMKYWYGETK